MRYVNGEMMGIVIACLVFFFSAGKWDSWAAWAMVIILAGRIERLYRLCPPGSLPSHSQNLETLSF